ncbi:MAG: Nif3-like dinuclear metal center hexameric protein [Victivallales bacterium]|nr:Nif3-like dinuclear metal center hexameric protein [Victivallales bacterium]MCF7889182.1 Nif3-like dinuclear metal center hexameric protein [Victivallales bacterium]
MNTLQNITEYLNNTIMLDQITCDPSHNGLQVEGKKEVKKAVFGVDTSERLIHKAIECNADMIFVHHGISWGSSLSYITSYNAKLLRPLIKNDISLYAAHLPLDAHPNFGHNALIADILKLREKKDFSLCNGVSIGIKGMLHNGAETSQIAEMIVRELDLIIDSYSTCTFSSELENLCRIIGKKSPVNKIGIISGSPGMDCIHDAIFEKLDCVITGELSHSMYHLSTENGISVIAPGHYRTEVPGVIAVMDLLRETFNLETEFINIPTGL